MTDFLLLDKSDKKPAMISMRDLEIHFGIIYRSHLTFLNDAMYMKAIANCPYILRFDWLAVENYALAEEFKDQLSKGMIADVYIKWIDDIMGYGLFANADLPAGTFVGEYTGVLRQLSRQHRDHNDYCLHYPTRFWSWNYMAIDALHEGNVTRFINHSDDPNLDPKCLVVGRVLHLVFITKKFVPRDSQLTFNYGPDFWSKTKTTNLNDMT